MNKVKHRTVFYIPGFDPRRPSFYYNLYKTEAKKQSKINGLNFDIGELEKIDESCFKWTIDSTDKSSGDNTHTDYHFLYWGDIVRKYWFKSPFEIVRAISIFIQYFSQFISTILRMFKVRSKAALFALAPTILFLFSLIISIVIGVLIWLFTCATLSTLFMLIAISVLGMITLWGMLFSTTNKTAWLWLFKLFRLNVFWILWAEEMLPDIKTKEQIFADHIINSITQSEIDEVLIVSHSTGNILAAEVLHRILQLVDITYQEKLKFITLGQSIPFMSLYKNAQSFIKKMNDIGQYENLLWIDYSFEGDGVAFYLTNPFSINGIECKNDIHILSINPEKIYKPSEYKNFSFNTKHFLYIMSTDYPDGYDYFKLTAGNIYARDFIKHTSHEENKV